MFKSLIDSFISLDRFTKIAIITLILIILATPFIVTNRQVFRGKAILPTPLGQSGDWTLVFDDEFDSTSLDSSKWVSCFPWGSDKGCGSTTTPETWYLPENVIVGNGMVRLRAQKQTVTGSDGKTYNYTSGIITSSKLYSDPMPYKFQFQYGYMEMRAKLPKGQGLWPAFWTLPPEGKWPPEIDIMENLGSQTNVQHMHYHYLDSAGVHQDSGGEWVGPDFSADWHVFGVSWEPDAIRWYVDGVERRTAFTDTQYIAAEPMYLLANLQVGGSWAGSPDSTTPFPSYYDIDYIRVWKQGVSSSPTPTPTPTPTHSSS